MSQFNKNVRNLRPRRRQFRPRSAAQGGGNDGRSNGSVSSSSSGSAKRVRVLRTPGEAKEPRVEALMRPLSNRMHWHILQWLKLTDVTLLARVSKSFWLMLNTKQSMQDELRVALGAAQGIPRLVPSAIMESRLLFTQSAELKQQPLELAASIQLQVWNAMASMLELRGFSRLTPQSPKTPPIGLILSLEDRFSADTEALVSQIQGVAPKSWQTQWWTTGLVTEPVAPAPAPALAAAEAPAVPAVAEEAMVEAVMVPAEESAPATAAESKQEAKDVEEIKRGIMLAAHKLELASKSSLATRTGIRDPKVVQRSLRDWVNVLTIGRSQDLLPYLAHPSLFEAVALGVHEIRLEHDQLDETVANALHLLVEQQRLQHERKQQVLRALVCDMQFRRAFVELGESFFESEEQKQQYDEWVNRALEVMQNLAIIRMRTRVVRVTDDENSRQHLISWLLERMGSPDRLTDTSIQPHNMVVEELTLSCEIQGQIEHEIWPLQGIPRAEFSKRPLAELNRLPEQSWEQKRKLEHMDQEAKKPPGEPRIAWQPWSHQKRRKHWIYQRVIQHSNLWSDWVEDLYQMISEMANVLEHYGWPTAEQKMQTAVPPDLTINAHCSMPEDVTYLWQLTREMHNAIFPPEPQAGAAAAAAAPADHDASPATVPTQRPWYKMCKWRKGLVNEGKAPYLEVFNYHAPGATDAATTTTPMYDTFAMVDMAYWRRAVLRDGDPPAHLAETIQSAANPEEELARWRWSFDYAEQLDILTAIFDWIQQVILVWSRIRRLATNFIPSCNSRLLHLLLLHFLPPGTGDDVKIRQPLGELGTTVLRELALDCNVWNVDQLAVIKRAFESKRLPRVETLELQSTIGWTRSQMHALVDALPQKQLKTLKITCSGRFPSRMPMDTADFDVLAGKIHATMEHLEIFLGDSSLLWNRLNPLLEAKRSEEMHPTDPIWMSSTDYVTVQPIGADRRRWRKLFAHDVRTREWMAAATLRSWPRLQHFRVQGLWALPQTLIETLLSPIQTPFLQTLTYIACIDQPSLWPLPRRVYDLGQFVARRRSRVLSSVKISLNVLDEALFGLPQGARKTRPWFVLTLVESAGLEYQPYLFPFAPEAPVTTTGGRHVRRSLFMDVQKQLKQELETRRRLVGNLTSFEWILEPPEMATEDPDQWKRFHREAAEVKSELLSDWLQLWQERPWMSRTVEESLGTSAFGTSSSSSSSTADMDIDWLGLLGAS